MGRRGTPPSPLLLFRRAPALVVVLLLLSEAEEVDKLFRVKLAVIQSSSPFCRRSYRSVCTSFVDCVDDFLPAGHEEGNNFVFETHSSHGAVEDEVGVEQLLVGSKRKGAVVLHTRWILASPDLIGGGRLREDRDSDSKGRVDLVEIHAV